MRLHTRTHKLERSGVSAEQEFSIRATAKSFEILSSGLYTDPKLAVIRELSCNAYDAHVAAGKKDEPFVVHLPNKLEPWLSIKDNGIGLSDEDVMTLYTTYFDSTKTDSNDFIGALGLGSKSPFSYTDTFEVISRFNGKRRMYSIFLNEGGVPTIARLSEVDTDECNGIEVKIMIKENDFYSFKEKVKRALVYFPVKPEVVGDSFFEFEELPTHRLEGDGWFIAQKGWGEHAFTAVQGNVAYRVDMNKLVEELTHEEQKFFEKARIVAYFSIGDLEVAASREEIRYDERSKQNLMKVVRQIRRDMTKVIDKKANEYKKCFWDACIELTEYSDELFGSAWGIKTFVVDPNSNTLLKYIEQSGHVTLPDLHGHTIAMYSPPRWRGAERLSRHDVGSTLTPKRDIVVFFDDVSTGTVSRITAYTKKTPYRHVLLIRRKKDKDMDYSVCPAKWSFDSEYKQLLNELGNPSVLSVTQETTKEKRPSGGTYSRNLPVYTFHSVDPGRYYGQAKVRWERVDESEDFDFANGGLYFQLKKGKRILTGDNKEVYWGVNSVSKSLNTMRQLVNKHYNFDFEAVYGVSNLALPKVKKMKGWYNIFDLFTDIVPDYEDAVAYNARAQHTSEHLDIKGLLSNVDFVDRVRDLDGTSTFKKLVLPMIEGFEKVKSVNGVAAFVRDFDFTYGKRVLDDLDTTPFYTREDFDVYPMLRFVGSVRTGSEGMKVLFDYIDMIDRS